MATIPASQLVSVIPSVISAGGSALDLNGVLLTNSLRIPMGQILQFPNQATVAAYFGASSTEATAATIYFNGFDTATARPGNLLMAQYNTAPVGAFLRGGSLSALTLSQLQAFSGTLTVTSNGTGFTSATINLSSATSFSNAATLIQAGFTSPTFTVTYDSVSGAFQFTSSTTGGTSTLTYATTGTLATNLKLTQATGAVLSQGAATAVPATFMAAFVNQTQNWATFTTLFDPDGGSGNTLKLAFAAWNNGMGNRYMYVPWDTDTSPTTTVPATTSLGYLIGPNGNNYSGTMCVYDVDYTTAVFICGSAASINFDQPNGRATFAYKSQSGLAIKVTDALTASNLIANGYNFYGAYATANQSFTFLQPGQVSGKFLWADSYINQIWMNNALQLALMELEVGRLAIPYAEPGYSAIRAAVSDPIQAAGTFGAFSAGAVLSNLQKSEVNAYVGGLNIAPTLQNQGWYFFIQPATAQIRAARTSPFMAFLYVDGGSIQKLALNSVEVQ